MKEIKYDIPTELQINVFKYISLDCLSKYKTICDGQLYLSSPHNFDDTLDGSLSFENHISEILEISYKSMDKVKGSLKDIKDDEFRNITIENIAFLTGDAFKKYLEDKLGNIFNNIRVTCFSLNNPFSIYSTRMWSEYANYNKGVSLTYDLSAFAQSAPNQDNMELIYARSINYSNDEVLKIVRNPFLLKDLPLFYDKILNYIMLKLDTWKDQQEVRLVGLSNIPFRNNIIDTINIILEIKHELNSANNPNFPYEEWARSYLKNRVDKIKNIMDKEVSTIENEISFIQPSSICFGYDCDIYERNQNGELILDENQKKKLNLYGQLFVFAQKNGIECVIRSRGLKSDSDVFKKDEAKFNLIYNELLSGNYL